MNPQQGAREILATAQAMYVPTHDYVSVRETDFPHLDLNFYRRTQAALEEQGFILLEDCENLTLNSVPGNVLRPVLIRVMASRDGTISASAYHPRLKALWLVIVTWLIRKHPGKTIDLETEFSDGSFVCTTNGMTAAAITLPASIDAEFLPQQATVGQLLERHRARVAEKIARTGTTAHSFSTIEDVRAMQNRMNAAKAAYRTQVGGVTKDELEKLSGGNHQIAHDVHREIQTLQDGQTASGDADDRLLAAVEARGENAGSKGSSNRVLLVTAALFVVLGGMNWGWKSVVFLTVAIALHEIGHVIAMRIFGYKNVRMLFLPMFGGLATGEPRELDATKNALIALAGPAFGVATTGVAIVIALLINQPPWLVQFAWVSLVLNAFNLIPLVPLDGGRFTNDALFSRYPVLELIFRLIAVGGLGWLAFNLEAWLLGGLALFMLITTQVTFRRACLIRDARRDPLWQTRPLDRETVVLLREIVGRIFKGVAPEKFSGKLPEHAHGIWLEIRKRFPGVGGTVGLLSAYVFLCVFIVPGMGFLMVWYLERPTF